MILFFIWIPFYLFKVQLQLTSASSKSTQNLCKCILVSKFIYWMWEICNHVQLNGSAKLNEPLVWCVMLVRSFDAKAKAILPLKNTHLFTISFLLFLIVIICLVHQIPFSFNNKRGRGLNRQKLVLCYTSDPFSLTSKTRTPRYMCKHIIKICFIMQ